MPPSCRSPAVPPASRTHATVELEQLGNSKHPARAAQTTSRRYPPRDLSPRSRVLWRRVVHEAAFEFEEHHYEQLAIACAAIDRAHEARDEIRAVGHLVPGRYGPALNPLIAVERESFRTALRAFAALRLDAPVGYTGRGARP